MNADEKILIGIAGIGLIGGSFAKALLAKGHGVVGFDNNAEVCKKAMELGVVQQADTQIKILDDCKAILVAVPVGQTKEVFLKIAALDATNLATIFDAGSVKASIIQTAKDSLGDKFESFVACHPIAGIELSGVAAATDDLFINHRTILCDVDEAKNCVKLAMSLWQQAGCVISIMDSEVHDRMFAAVSHLPHLLAFALVGDLGKRSDRDQLLANAAGGFADFTRIASSDPNMWRDVFLANRENVIGEIDSFLEQLTSLKDSIKADDGKALHNFFEKARNLRDNWIATSKK